jgi:hypothetical protein
MSEYSIFNSYGQLEYSSDVPEAEKIYESMRASYTHPKTGLPIVDMTPGSYHESKIYARAMAIADANAATRRAGNQEDPLKATENLPIFETELRIAPKPTATLDQRRAAVAARRLRSRGNRREAIYDGLRQILGNALIAVRPIARSEATLWPTTPLNASRGPGVFARPSQPAKLVRLLDPVTHTGFVTSDSYSETNQDADAALQDTVGADLSAIGQSFLGNDGALLKCAFYLKKTGAPTGNAVAKVYAHAGTLGASSIPTGAPLAISSPVDVSSLTTLHVLTDFSFVGANQVILASGTPYVVVLEYSGGSGGNVVQAGIDLSAPTHGGNLSTFGTGAWSPLAGADACFYVFTTLGITYQNWDVTRADLQLAKGDVLCVQPENLGLAEKITVVAVEGSGPTRTMHATFSNAHDAGAAATTGATPIWWSNTGHLLVVVTAAAALNAELCGRVNELLTRIAKGGTTWSIVEPTTAGATTVGPYTLGVSPLGAVPIGTVQIAAPGPLAITFVTPSSGPIAGGTALVIGGSGFMTAVSLTINGGIGLAGGFTIVNDNQITCVTDASIGGGGTFPLVIADALGRTVKASFTFV